MSDRRGAAVETYRNGRRYPFCPGCGHGVILDRLDGALQSLALDPRQIVIVTDIGCVGLSDQYFATNAFHGLHGRSVAYATGMKLARPDLKVIVLMGDGGVGIGGAHLVNATRRNVGVTVLVFNNFNFGMTGGEHSVTTPTGAITTTSYLGHLERPLDVVQLVAPQGAGFVWRGTAFDKELDSVIARAITHDGFALLDIWELCTAYFVPNNRFSRRALEQMLVDLNFPTGVLAARSGRPEYAAAYRQIHQTLRGQPALPAQPLAPMYHSSLDRPFRLVVAGSAGGRVRSAVRLAGVAGVFSGLHAAQRDDYPVTVKSGHSVSELVLSPEEILYTGIERPDALILLTEDGLRMAGDYLACMMPEQTLFVVPELQEVSTRARKAVMDPSTLGIRIGREERALAAVSMAFRDLSLFPVAALAEAIRQTQPPAIAEENLKVIAAVMPGESDVV
jgi:2-oxoglutarate ferredoxin oxidoreductase subunit beta